MQSVYDEQDLRTMDKESKKAATSLENFESLTKTCESERKRMDAA
jgi:hypothetical protein